MKTNAKFSMAAWLMWLAVIFLQPITAWSACNTAASLEFVVDLQDTPVITLQPVSQTNTTASNRPHHQSGER